MCSPVCCAVTWLGMGKGHSKGFAESPDPKLVAVADPEEMCSQVLDRLYASARLKREVKVT